MKHPVLITGGAGYIGSHIAHLLCDHGYEVVAVATLGKSNGANLPPQVKLYQQNVLDTDALKSVITRHKIKTVIHMAALISVEESVAKPLEYYRNNIDGTRSVLQACVDAGVEKLVFSSTAAIYSSSHKPLKETDATVPSSPYGHSKLMAEQMIRDTVAASNLKAVILRYFNAAGADPKGRAGQQGKNATHLIACACQAAAGDRAELAIFGTDYDTPDGTCVRDYIHVSDLAEAHRVVMEQDFAEPVSLFNCGYGTGYSVKQVVNRFREITGVDFPVRIAGRRPGDAVEVIGDNSLLLKETSWRPQYNDLDTIIRSAWDWYYSQNLAKARKAA